MNLLEKSGAQDIRDFVGSPDNRANQDIFGMKLTRATTHSKWKWPSAWNSLFLYSRSSAFIRGYSISIAATVAMREISTATPSSIGYGARSFGGASGWSRRTRLRLPSTCRVMSSTGKPE